MGKYSDIDVIAIQNCINNTRKLIGELNSTKNLINEDMHYVNSSFVSNNAKRVWERVNERLYNDIDCLGEELIHLDSFCETIKTYRDPNTKNKEFYEKLIEKHYN